MYKERLDQAWKKVTVDWVDGTMELAVTLWEARENLGQGHSADKSFGQWLTEQGYGKTVISHQDRSSLINMGNPKYREKAKEVLIRTHLASWQHIWREETIPFLVESGLREQPIPRNQDVCLRGPRKHAVEIAEKTFPGPTIPQPPVLSKHQLAEREMLQQLNEKEGYKAWIVVEDDVPIGRMPDNAKQRFYEHIREVNQHCHELFQLSLYVDQMDEVAKQRLAIEFKGIKKWGQILAERMLGHKRLSQVDAPMCDVETPFRKQEN
jgi:hypothetical protein